MDSSLPVLVARLPDRRALALLARAALRHEVAQIELAKAPERSAPHTLDLHVDGQPTLRLLAEPAGTPLLGQFPLRLRPLYRAQISTLYALLDAERLGIDRPPDSVAAQTALPDTPSPATPGRAPSSVELDLDAGKVRRGPLPTTDGAPAARAAEEPRRPPPSVIRPPRPSSSSLDGDPRRTTPSAMWPSQSVAPKGPRSKAPSDVPETRVDHRLVAPDSFFDSALTNLPAPLFVEDEETPAEEGVTSVAESIRNVGPSEIELLDKRLSASAPASRSTSDVPTRAEGVVPILSSPEDEDDATLVRVSRPSGLADTSSSARPAVRPAAGEMATSPSGRAPPGADPAVGRRIADGKYIIESLIGSGAAGAVYRATHRELRRTVAIKILHPHYQQDPHFMESFRGEALAASQLDHPNVMRVLDFDQEPDGLIYIVMEYLSGRTLQNLLDEERRLPAERAVEIMVQVCAALSVAHDHGIIHRDIKPDNIMLVPSRNDEGRTYELVKVCDFGIAALQNARPEDAALEASEHVIAGTPEYMSPEQARGTEVDARSDVYACGICLYELVTGRPPFFGGNPAEILLKQIDEIPKAPSQIIKGLDPIIEEVILRAIQKDRTRRHRTARELRAELKELIDPGDRVEKDDSNERSLVENVPGLGDPASGFPTFFRAFSSAVLRLGRFERGNTDVAAAMAELKKAGRLALRGREELTFARRDVDKTVGFIVMSGAEIVDLRKLLGPELMANFGEPFTTAVVEKGIASLTLREGMPSEELAEIIEVLLGSLTNEELRKTLLAKALQHVSILFVSDVIGRERDLSWKVGFCASRLARDLHALCNVRGTSLKKLRETRNELVGGVARLLTRPDEVRQFIFNADLVEESVENLRGFASFKVAPLIIERVLHESCAETALLLLRELDDDDAETEKLRVFLQLFGQRLVTERSPQSDTALAEFLRRKIIAEKDMPRDLSEAIRAQTLADALVREPTQFLRTLDLIVDAETYIHELTTLEAAMTTLARRSEAVALLAVMNTLLRHASGTGADKIGRREQAALRTLKSMIEKQRLLPIATTLLGGPPHQHEAARQIIVLAGAVGAHALYAAREGTSDPTARHIFVKVWKDLGPAGWTLLTQVFPTLEVRDDTEIALVEDLLRAMPTRADVVLGDVVAKYLTHPRLRVTALAAIVPLWGERARKALCEALDLADDTARITALTGLRRLQVLDEPAYLAIERILTVKGNASDELRAAAAGALADVLPPLRPRAVQLLSKAVEGKRGFVAMLRGDGNGDESVVVMEAMGRALLVLDRSEGLRALKGRVSRSEGVMRARLMAVLQMA